MAEQEHEISFKEYFRRVKYLVYDLLSKNQPIPIELWRAYTNIQFLEINDGCATLRYGV